MKSLRLLPCAVVLGCVLASTSAVASEASLVTAVYSEVANGYERPRLPDGSLKREYYAIARGGYAPGTVQDRSIEGVKFPAIAGMVAQFLAGRNYYFAPDSRSADLLLVISWGTTIPYRDAPYRDTMTGVLSSMNSFSAANAAYQTAVANSGGTSRDAAGIQIPSGAVRAAALDGLQGQLYTMQMFEGMRRSADEGNARLLGYIREINYRDNPSRLGGAGTSFDDLMSDIETARYYVVVAAYDFRAATRQKLQKLLWVTRVSIQAQGNRFNERLRDMLANAARYFGQDSGHLIRQYQQGSVSFGELKFLGYEPKVAPPAEPSQKP